MNVKTESVKYDFGDVQIEMLHYLPFNEAKNMNKRFKLLQSTPKSYVGEIFEDKCGTFVGLINGEEFRHILVINQPKWFEEIKENFCECKSWSKVGVGSGDGDLFVHGDYDSVKAVQGIVLDRGALDTANRVLRKLNADLVKRNEELTVKLKEANEGLGELRDIIVDIDRVLGGEIKKGTLHYFGYLAFHECLKKKDKRDEKFYKFEPLSQFPSPPFCNKTPKSFIIHFD